MNYGGQVCTILNNVLQKVTILLLTMFTILPEAQFYQRHIKNLEELGSYIVHFVNMLM